MSPFGTHSHCKSQSAYCTLGVLDLGSLVFGLRFVVTPLIDESEDIPWYCVKCTSSKIAEMFPFLSLDNNEINNLHHIENISSRSSSIL